MTQISDYITGDEGVRYLHVAITVDLTPENDVGGMLMMMMFNQCRSSEAK